MRAVASTTPLVQPPAASAEVRQQLKNDCGDSADHRNCQHTKALSPTAATLPPEGGLAWFSEIGGHEHSNQGPCVPAARPATAWNL